MLVTNHSGHGPASHRIAWNLVIVVFALTPAVVKAIYYPEYPGSDDAFIHLTVARNLATGQQWGIESGNPVPLSSSPAFTLVLTGIYLLGVDARIGGMLASGLFGIAGLALLAPLTRRITNRRPLIIATLAIGAFNIHLWRWNGVVMETTMAVMFLGLVFYFYYGKLTDARYGLVLTGILAGLATLVRFELGLLSVCLTLDLLVNNARRSRVRSVLQLWIGFALVCGCWCGFSQLYFGALLPTTYFAKTGAVHLVNKNVAVQLGQVIGAAFAVPMLTLFLLSAVSMKPSQPSFRSECARTCASNIGLVAFPLALFAFYYLRTDNLQSAARYCLPALFVLPLLFALVAECCCRRAHVSVQKRVSGVLLAMCTLQAASAVLLNHLVIAPTLRGFYDNYFRAMNGATDYLVARCGPTDTVLICWDIGVVAYSAHGRFRIADGGALASPELLGMNPRQMMERVKPKFIVESLGGLTGSLADAVPNIELVYSDVFKSHGISSRAQEYCVNVFAPVDMR